jgi:formylglycine-generating enzyme required for sulfatase activity
MMRTAISITILVLGLLGDGPPTTLPAHRARVSGGESNLGVVATLDVDAAEVTRGEFALTTSCASPDIRFFVDVRTESLPRNGVTHAEAECYCQQKGMRLPTEVEWEWVARSGKSQLGNPWQRVEQACRFAVLADDLDGEACGYGEPWPVSSLRRGATVQGVFHMAGNVAEWTNTLEGESAVVRGGDYSSAATEGGIFARRVVPTTARPGEVGFRCVTAVAE